MKPLMFSPLPRKASTAGWEYSIEVGKLALGMKMVWKF